MGGDPCSCRSRTAFRASSTSGLIVATTRLALSSGSSRRLCFQVEIVEHPWSGLRAVWAPKDAVIDWEKIRPSGFHVLKWRWIVERTFAWLSTWRRLAKDYEVLPGSEEAWIYVAMIRLMVRRLASAAQAARERVEHAHAA